MFKSIFQRLLFTYAAIILLVVTLLAALMTFFFNNYVYEQKQSQLLATGRRVEELTQKFSSLSMTEDDLMQTVNSLGQVTDSRIYVLMDKKLASLKLLGRQAGGQSDLVDDISKIYGGETLTRKKYFSSQMNKYVLFVGMPVYVDNTVSGVILLFSPLDQVNKTLVQVYKIIWGTATASLFLAAAIILIMSRRISRPIEKIQQAAESIAGGGFAEDIPAVGKDEIARLTGTFNFMKNRLRQIEEIRKDLIANVSHELRTPLTSIRGFIMGILDGLIKPEEQEKYLQRAYNETGRMERLVSDTLQLARIQSNTLKLNLERVHIGSLISDIIEETAITAAQKGITLESDILTGGATVLADRDRITQVILNLLQNALNYSPEGGKVQVRALAEDKRLLVKIRDNGPGIPEDQLDLIFQKYHRVPGSSQVPGTGLGLSIAKELVELHGGTIYAASTVGQGTEITFSLAYTELSSGRNTEIRSQKPE